MRRRPAAQRLITWTVARASASSTSTPAATSSHLHDRPGCRGFGLAAGRDGVVLYSFVKERRPTSEMIRRWCLAPMEHLSTQPDLVPIASSGLDQSARYHTRYPRGATLNMSRRCLKPLDTHRPAGSQECEVCWAWHPFSSVRSGLQLWQGSFTFDCFGLGFRATCFDDDLHSIFHRIFEGHLDSEQAVLVGRFGFVRLNRPT